jgi:hypothetical protein
MSCSDNFSYGRSIKQGPRSGKFSCFLSKTQRLNNPWIPIFIPSFHNYATEICYFVHIRALKMYIKRTESQRKEIDSDSLFITYQKGVCKPVSKNSVARRIVSLIKWVYQDTSKHLSTVRAHDKRKLATSWALFNGASITEIIRVLKRQFISLSILTCINFLQYIIPRICRIQGRREGLIKNNIYPPPKTYGCL